MGTIGLRFPPASGTDPQQHAAQLALLASDVAHVPPEYLERAAKEWAVKSPYMPKASELIGLAQGYVIPDKSGGAQGSQERLDFMNSSRTRKDVEWYYDNSNTPRLRFVKNDFDHWIDSMNDREIPQWKIDDKPDQWKRVAVERGLLTRLSYDDGSLAGYIWRIPFEQRASA